LQAETAVRAGEDQVARLVLQEKITYEQQAEQYKELYEQNIKSIVELEKQISELKADYEQVKQKRVFYAARLQSVQLQQKMNAYLPYGSSSASGMLRRLEDRLSDLEAEARSLRDVRKIGEEIPFHVSGSKQHALELELARLKDKLAREGGLQQ
jgi:phage shock protein A